MTVGTFDPESRTRLLGTQIELTHHARFEDLHHALERGEHSVAIVSLEALGSDAPARLALLRSAAPRARIILAHEQGVGRTRFAHRLWMVGDCDAAVASTDTQKLGEAVERFEIEVRLSSSRAESEPDGFRAMRDLFSSLAGQDSLESILTEFSRGTRRVIDYEILVLMVREPNARARLFTFQSTAAAHDVLFDLAGRCCTAVSELTGEKAVSADDLEYVQPTLLHHQRQSDALEAVSPEQVACSPLVAGHRVIGCAGAIAPASSPWTKDSLSWFYLAVGHLSVALEHARLLREAQRLSVTDPLTGVNNRRFLEKVLPGEWARARRYSLQLSVAIVDIDHFSQVNELRGRAAADTVLITLAGALRELVRTADHVVRWGGDQFLVLLPETGSSGAERLIDRLRIRLKATPIEAADGRLHISISCGVASHPTVKVSTAEELIGQSEQAVAKAKASARSRTVHAGEAVIIEESKSGIDQRRETRMPLELPVTFVPVAELDPRSTLRLSSVNISARGIALRDRARLLKRDSYGLVFFDDRPHPLLCRVAWSRPIEGEYHAGLTILQAGDFHDSWGSRRWESRRALVITENAEYAAVAKRVLRTTKHAVQVWDPRQAEGLSDEALAECSLVIIGDKLLGTEVGARLFEMRRREKSELRIILLNEDLDREGAIEMISEQHVEHLISSRAHPAESLFTTLTKMLRPEFFGVHRYLLAGADTKTWTVAKPSEKGYVLAGVRAVAEDVDCHPRIADLLISAVDEMLINALYNSSDRRVLVERSVEGTLLPRTTLDTPEPSTTRLNRGNGEKQLPVTVECGADGRLLCVGVLDDHGVLEVDQIYAGLQAAARARSDGLPENAESASLGFRIMLGALSQLAINVEPGRRTELIGIIDLRKTLREHRASAPSLGIFKK